MSEQVEMEEEDRGSSVGNQGGEKKRFEVKKVGNISFNFFIFPDRIHIYARNDLKWNAVALWAWGICFTSLK